MIHKRFSNLTVISDCGKDKHGALLWLCICDCGGSKAFTGSTLRNGIAKSCGCVYGNTKHGLRHTNGYSSWQSMITRCTNKNHKSYENYGARGITVSEEWLDCANFFRDMGARPDGMTLERIDNSKGYFKENCKWATRAEQNRNHRRNIMITFNGKTQCLKDWAIETQIKYDVLIARINKLGWSIEKTLTQRSRNALQN